MAYIINLFNTLLLVSILSNTYGQGFHFKIDSCGVENGIELNQHEAEYFNYVFSEIKEDFCFINKKVVFGEGFMGRLPLSKSSFFERYAGSLLMHYVNYSEVFGGIYLIILNDDEKELSDLFDAIIIIGSKAVPVAENRKQLIVECVKRFSKYGEK